MSGHEMKVKTTVHIGYIVLTCECGFIHRFYSDSCTLKELACRAATHKAEVLIKARESLGVGQTNKD